jgi:hypothetical protein
MSKRGAENGFLHFHLSVGLSAYISSAPTQQIFMKGDIGDFCENLSNKSKFD